MSTPESEVVQDSTNDEVTLESLEQMAEAVDRGETIEPESQPEPDPGETQAEPEGEAQVETESSVSADDDSSLKSESEETRPTKADKDNSRLDRSWKKHNESKEELAAERAAFEREREKYQREKSKHTDDYKDSDGRTSQDYELYARQMEADGEYEKADWGRKAAERVKAEAANKAADAELKEFQQKWSENFNKLCEENPDLNNRTSKLYQTAESLIRDRQYLLQTPSGINDAVEYAKLLLEQSEKAELKDSLSKAEKEIEEYKSKLNISGSPPAERPGVTRNDKLSEEDQFKRLEKLAAEFDRQGQPLIGG
jgi:hypothetical protein